LGVFGNLFSKGGYPDQIPPILLNLHQKKATSIYDPLIVLPVR